MKDDYGNEYIYKKDGLDVELVLYMEKQAYGDTIPDYAMFIDNTFTQIEVEQDIDIQSIEELDVQDNQFNTYNKTLKINEIIKAVKQLDRKINQ